MSIFGPRYSREGYEEAKEQADSDYKTARWIGTLTGPNAQAVYDGLWEASHESKRKLEKMHAAGQKEAAELNREYDRLQQKVAAALTELQTFQREKLGITPHEQKPSEHDDTDTSAPGK